MAAIYSGIHLKLKSPQTQWEDKLKLARFAWISSQCLLPNKEQVLLDWCTHALTGWYHQKVEFSHHVLEGLWCYLDDLLHSRKLHLHLKQGRSISLRHSMAQLLLDRLQEFARVDSKPLVSLSTILSVCQGIFSSPVLSSVFTTKYELMVDLLTKACFLSCCELQQPLFTKPLKSESVTCQDEMITECSAANLDSFDPPPNDSELDNNCFLKPKESHRSSSLFEVLLQVLSCYLSVQRQQANPNRVFTMVTNHLIQPLVLLRYLLTSGEFVSSHTCLCLHQQLSRDIRVKIDSVLQLALFLPELVASYKEELLPCNKDSGKGGSGGTKGPLKPVSTIMSKLSAEGHCEPSLHYSVKSSTSSILFKFFVESYAKGREESVEEQRMLCFYFLIRLVPVLDLNLNEHSPGKAEQPPSSPQSWSLALLAVESLLSQAFSADIYNVAADRIRHKEVQLRFYKALSQMLFNQAQPSIPVWYRCLKVLLSLNHLILEPDLDQLLSSAWVNSECMEARVQRARQLMVCSLLQTYTKLRQLPRLFSELLTVICQPSLDQLRPPLLSEAVSTSLRTSLLDTPPSQCLEICSLVLDSIRTHILPDLLKQGGAEETMEIVGGGYDKAEKRLDQEKNDASVKLFSHSQLLHAVLFNLKSVDNTSPVPLIRQSQRLMEGMQQLIKELLELLLKEKNTSSVQKTPKKGKKNLKPRESERGVLWKQKTLEAALLLRYTWVEVDMCFDIHCSKYTSLDSAQLTAAGETEDGGRAPVLDHIESLVSGNILPAPLHPSPSCSPMSCLLLKLLVLQQMKKVLLDGTLRREHGSTLQLNRAAHCILAKSEFEGSLDGEQLWDGQVDSVSATSYRVAHWYLITTNLPLIAPYLSEEDVRCFADVLMSSFLSEQPVRGENQLPSSLTVSLISSQLLQSSMLAELPSLFSATVGSLTQRIIGVLVAAHGHKVCSTLLKFQEVGIKSSHPLSKPEGKETIAEDILEASKTGLVFVLLNAQQTKELMNTLRILTSLNPDGMSSEDLSSIFLLLLFVLTSTSRLSDQAALDHCDPGDDATFLVQLLRLLTCLMGGRNFQGVLKFIHGGSLLQAAVSSLLWHSNSGRFRATHSADWLDLIKAVQDFITALVQLIINRSSSVKINLDQFASFLTSKKIPNRQIVASSSAAATSELNPGASVLSVHLLLASLAAFSQMLTSNLGRSKPLDQTFTQILKSTNASLGSAVESVLKTQGGVFHQAGLLSQAFVVNIVSAMLHCELSVLSVEVENKLTLQNMSFYQSFCQQILREMSSAPRPVDFLVSSFSFLSTFYEAVGRTRGEGQEAREEEEEVGGEEQDELYIQILDKVHRLLTASWLSSADASELESALNDLLRHLLVKCTKAQFSQLLLMIREGLDVCKLRAGNYKEVLSAVTITKLLSSCQLPEACSKALWLIAPQIISAMVFLVRSSAEDVSLTPAFTVPTVTSVTSLLRQGERRFPNPHHVTLVLGALQSVPLHHLTPAVYRLAFLCVHEALFAIVQCHPQVLLNVAPSFLNVFYRLVASIMQEGRQRGDSDTGTDVYVQCSRLVERMYSHIAAMAETFTSQSVFMVAQYVTELQKVTLRPDVKLHLTEGIYQILDLCVEQDIKFVLAGLPTGVREVFNELYASYTHYHKAQRQGEDKYTV
ncbi:unhealthy ribosome biogenesis protein 2 homolog [Betta splendens]|uniref:Unhealthy ribosome biogenesis protein 2 homolog n=1 Tax=Betta splendens TaxID=158456 RepID=A0A6P7M1A3_BETSP|nr:unhealthy ribosome biogenesis protein 2 homolog [Betta splendens]XP_028999949.1 unhealthy ribosome biogenesis protein 2 homolog [Betta splendens]